MRHHLKVQNVRSAAVRLGVVGACLVLAAPLSAQELKPRATFRGHTNAVTSLAFSPDGKTLASGCTDSSLKLWDAATGRNTTTLKEDQPYLWESVVFSPDGKTLVSGGWFNKIKQWDLGTLKGTLLLDEPLGQLRVCPVPLVVISPNGKILASGRDCSREIRLRDLTTDKQTFTLEGHDESGVNCLSFTPDSKLLMSVGHDAALKLWDVSTGKMTVEWKLSEWTEAVAISPDGKIVATAVRVVERINDMRVVTDKSIKLWDIASGQKLAAVRPGAKTDPAVVAGLVRQLGSDEFDIREKASRNLGKLDEVPDALRDAVKSADAEVARRAALAVAAITAGIDARSTLKGHTAAVSALVFSPDSKTLATASEDTTIKLWDVATGKELAILKGHTDKVSSLAYSPDGKTLASGSDDKTILLWDMPKAK